MNTYFITSFKEKIYKIIKPLKKRFSSKVNILKQNWNIIMPEWAKETIPKSIKNEILTVETNKNAIFLQFKEQELLKICNLLLNNEIKRIKIINK